MFFNVYNKYLFIIIIFAAIQIYPQLYDDNSTINADKVLLKKQSIQCACLGTVLKLPMTEATLIENSIMIVMATVMIIG